MPSKRLLSSLLFAALLLPAAIVVFIAVGRLLTSLGDRAGGAVLERLALAGGVGWLLVLLALVLATAARSVRDHDEERPM